MIFGFDKFFSVCILCSFFLLSQKSYAFDYGKYNKEHRQLRSVTIIPSSASVTSGNKKEHKPKAIKVLIQKLLAAMENDTVPVKLFETDKDFSIYFKPAKISKLGIKYKF